MAKDLDKGKNSKVLGSDHLREVWSRCDRMNEGRPPEAGHYVPMAAIVLRDDLLVRPIDKAVVAQYRECIALLPPVMLQKDTFALVDGRQRYHAVDGQRDYILAFEADIADADLRDYAIRANINHGKPYSKTEREALALDIIDRHPDWSAERVSEWSGVSVWWAKDQHRKRVQEAAPLVGNIPVTADPNPSLGGNIPVEPRKVLGKDGVLRKSVAGNLPKKTKRQPSPPVTREPIHDYEPEYEDLPRDWDDEPSVATEAPLGEGERGDTTGGDTPFAQPDMHSAATTSPAEIRSASVAKGAAGSVHAGTSSAHLDGGRAVSHDPDWEPVWQAVATLADCQSDRRDAVAFLSSVPENWKRPMHADIAAAIAWLSALQDAEVFA